MNFCFLYVAVQTLLVFSAFRVIRYELSSHEALPVISRTLEGEEYFGQGGRIPVNIQISGNLAAARLSDRYFKSVVFMMDWVNGTCRILSGSKVRA